MRSATVTPVPLDVKQVDLSKKTPKSPKIKSKRITINARGVEYKIPLDTLDKLPDSRLGKLKLLIENPKSLPETLDDLCDKYDQNKQTFYFDKDPMYLNLILNYFNNGKLHIEENICGYSINEELEYWQIGEEILDDCCKHKYYKEIDTINDRIKDEEEIIKKYNKKNDFGKHCFPKARAKGWKILESKETCLAKVCLKFRIIIHFLF